MLPCFSDSLKNQLFLDLEEEQVYRDKDRFVAMLQQYDSGMKETDICRDKGIVTVTFYSWKLKYGSMDAQQIKELKSLQKENRRLKQMYADLGLDHHILDTSPKKKSSETLKA